jgi:hypothetical protein
MVFCRELLPNLPYLRRLGEALRSGRIEKPFTERSMLVKVRAALHGVAQRDGV